MLCSDTGFHHMAVISSDREVAPNASIICYQLIYREKNVNLFSNQHTVWKNTVKHYHAQKFSVKPQLQNYAKSTFTNA